MTNNMIHVTIGTVGKWATVLKLSGHYHKCLHIQAHYCSKLWGYTEVVISSCNRGNIERHEIWQRIYFGRLAVLRANR